MPGEGGGQVFNLARGVSEAFHVGEDKSINVCREEQVKHLMWGEPSYR